MDRQRGDDISETLASPCNGVCRLDESTGWCLGCWRTLGEIAAWSKVPEAQRQAILSAMAWRKKGLHEAG